MKHYRIYEIFDEYSYVETGFHSTPTVFVFSVFIHLPLSRQSSRPQRESGEEVVKVGQSFQNT